MSVEPSEFGISPKENNGFFIFKNILIIKMAASGYWKTFHYKQKLSSGEILKIEIKQKPPSNSGNFIFYLGNKKEENVKKAERKTEAIRTESKHFTPG